MKGTVGEKKGLKCLTDQMPYSIVETGEEGSGVAAGAVAGIGVVDCGFSC